MRESRRTVSTERREELGDCVNRSKDCIQTFRVCSTGFNFMGVSGELCSRADVRLNQIIFVETLNKFYAKNLF